MNQLQDKVAIVTGGGSGINLAFSKLLYNAGCKILIVDLALHAEAKNWLSEISLKGREDCQIGVAKADVTDWVQLEKSFDIAVSKFGQEPDIIVPGAGVYEPSSNSFWADSDEDSRYKVLDINLTHPIKMSRIAIRRWVATQMKGTIIHLSSIAGQRSSIVTPLYTASKHGINSFVRGMGPLEELAGIRVLAVAPGTVGTPLFTEHPEAAKFLDMEKDHLLDPEDIANAMLALLTDPAYKGGTVLEVCHKSEWRLVSLLDDPGPRGPASLTSRKSEAVKEIVRHLGIDPKHGLTNTSTD